MADVDDIFVDDDDKNLEGRGDDITDDHKEKMPPRDGQGRFTAGNEGAALDDKEKAPDKAAAKEKAKDAADDDAVDEEGADDDGADDAEDENEGDEAGDKTPKDVPYARFREVVEQRNALKKQAAEASKTDKVEGKAQSEAEAAVKELHAAIDALYEQVEDARADGDTKKAAQLQRSLDDAKGRLARYESAIIARRETYAVTQAATYNDMLDKLESVYPVINPNEPEFDKDVVAELDFQVQAYERMGLAPVAALNRAVHLILGAPAAPVKDEKTKKAVGRKTDIKKNVDAAKRTPPTVDRAEGKDVGATVDVDDLSDEDWAALPASKRAELRGDFRK